MPAAPERYARIALALGVDTAGMDIDQAAYAGVEALERLVDDVGIPTMVELGFSEDEIPMLAQIAYDDPQTLGNPRVLSVDDYEGSTGGRSAREHGDPRLRDGDRRRRGRTRTPGSRRRAPASGESLGSVPEGTREDAQRAIAAANGAWRDWSAAPPSSAPRRWSGSPT